MSVTDTGVTKDLSCWVLTQRAQHRQAIRFEKTGEQSLGGETMNSNLGSLGSAEGV